MQEILSIRWDTGSMDIVVANFFPCSLPKLRKILKLNEMDWGSRREDNLEFLKNYFQEQIPLCEEAAKKAGKEYWDYHQKVADTKTLIKTKKKPNGVPLKEAELDDARNDLKMYQYKEAKFLSEYKRESGKVPKFKRLLEEISK